MLVADLSGGGIASHVELPIVLMRDMEAQPFIEPTGGIDFRNAQLHRLIQHSSLGNQAMHNLGPNTPPLKRTVHKELPNEKCFVLRERLHPTYVGTIQRRCEPVSDPIAARS